MRVLLCGEGLHEIGDPDCWSDRQQCYLSLPGWLHIFARRLLEHCDDVEFEVKRRSELVLLPRLRRGYQPAPDGHGAKALIAKFIAGNEGYDVVVFMADHDGTSKREWKIKHAQIIEGFDRVDNEVIGIACLPMTASESWLLADEGVWQELGLEDKNLLPKKPEEMSGDKHDPRSNDPHRCFERVCGSAGVKDDRGTRVKVSKVINFDKLEEKCPVSFIPFRQKMNELEC